MKKVIYSAALLAAVMFTSCGDNTSTGTTSDATTEVQHEMKDSSDLPTETVVETPDYTDAAAPVKQQVATLLENYLTLKDALVAGDSEAAKTAASTVLTSAEAIPVATLADEQKQFAEENTTHVKNVATQIAAATDLDAQRENLELLSEATFALTKAFGATDQKLYYQHCPMANNDEGGYWLSANKEIRNPYFGDKMMKCGANKEVLN